MFTPTPSSLFLVDPPKKIPTADEYKIEPKIIHHNEQKLKFGRIYYELKNSTILRFFWLTLGTFTFQIFFS